MSLLLNEYEVRCHDGTSPTVPCVVLDAADPFAAFALLAYAAAAKNQGMASGYVEEVRYLAAQFQTWLDENGAGDPDAPAPQDGGHVLWRGRSREGS